MSKVAFAPQSASLQPWRASKRSRQHYWLLRAADAAWQEQDTRATQTYLEQLDPGRLAAPERPLANLLRVASNPDQYLPHRSIMTLDFASRMVPDNYRVLLHRLRAAAYLEAGQPYRSASEHIELGAFLLDPVVARDNREQILAALQRLTARQVQSYLQLHHPDDEMFGWLALVEMLKVDLFGGQPVDAVIASWRSRFPQHPANRDSVAGLLDDYDLEFSQPAQVALLLPLSGSGRNATTVIRAATAVRDGFMAAYYADRQRQAELRIYDTGQTGAAALRQYRQALADGATQIVGPLQREAVTAVLLEADGRVPLLALNHQQTKAPTAPRVFQFGLTPEAEATHMASYMLENGHGRAVVLAPTSPWGQRMEAAFVTRFEQLGGQILGSYRYGETELDFGNVVRQAVGIIEASLRERQLRRVLGADLSFEAQPRHDLDAIFVAARPAQGRLIKPQLAFYNAGDLPAYATSHIYSGRRDPEADRDLNGMQFCDVPWLLGGHSFDPSLESVRNEFPEAKGNAVRLFALGVDAYRSLPYLDWLTEYRSDTFPGVTGQLSIDRNGRVLRRLDCATFRRGVARYQPPAAELADTKH